MVFRKVICIWVICSEISKELIIALGIGYLLKFNILTSLYLRVDCLFKLTKLKINISEITVLRKFIF